MTQARRTPGAGGRIGLSAAARRCLAAAAAVWVAAPLALAAQPLRFAPERDYGPFVFVGDDGRVQGLSVDLLERLAQAAGLTLQTLPAAPLAEQLARVQAGQADLVSSLRPTPERAAFLAFTRPYVSVPAIVVRRAPQAAAATGPNGQATLEALAGRVVAVGAGYGVEPFVRSRYPAVRWAAVPDDVQALRGVVEGRHEAAVVDAASAAFVVRRHGLQGLQSAGPIGFEYALSLAVPKARTDLVERLDAAISALPLQERSAIQARWMGPLDGHALMARPQQTLWWAAGWMGLALALGAVALWRWRRGLGDRRAAP